MKLKRGSKGKEVVDLQKRLKSLGFSLGLENIDGFFGINTEKAVKSFQQKRGLKVTGIIDPNTWREIVEAGYTLGSRTLYLKEPPFRGDDVKTLQYYLNSLGFNAGVVTGIFDRKMESAVRKFQKNLFLDEDGIVGQETIKSLNNLKRSLERETGYHIPKRKIDKQIKLVICVDPGHGLPSDSGRVGVYGLTEAEVCWEIAENLIQEISIMGISGCLTHEIGENLNGHKRAEAANSKKVNILISIHLNYLKNPLAKGSSCYYFSSGVSFSNSGKILSNLIQDHLIKRMKVQDCRVHGMNIPVLRETKMTSVRVEPGFISNPEEEKMMETKHYRKDVAVAIAEGIRHFLNMGIIRI